MKTDKELTYNTFRAVFLKSAGIKKTQVAWRRGGWWEKTIGNLLLYVSNIVDNSLNFPSSFFKPSFLFFFLYNQLCLHFLKSFIVHPMLRSVWDQVQVAAIVASSVRSTVCHVAVLLLNSSVCPHFNYRSSFKRTNWKELELFIFIWLNK